MEINRLPPLNDADCTNAFARTVELVKEWEGEKFLQMWEARAFFGCPHPLLEPPYVRRTLVAETPRLLEWDRKNY